MKNIIPFKKDIIFKTNIDEVTSISLENTLKIDNDTVSGNFIISGEYRITEASSTVEQFSFNIPFLSVIDEKYDTTNSIVDIDDFYYEILNNNVLLVSIDVLVDKLREKELPHIDEIPDLTVDKDIIEDDIFDSIDNRGNCDIEKNIDMFSTTSKEENYVSYNIYIIRTGDTLDTILEKYNTTQEELEKYNDITDLKIGDKIIIPSK